MGGRIRFTAYRAGTKEMTRQSGWIKNLVVSGTNTGRNLICQRLGGTNTYTLNITHGDIGRGYAAPGAPSVATGAAGVLTGAYKYRVTFVTAIGETEGGTVSSTVNPSSQQVSVTAMPTGPSGVTSRKLYRTLAGGSTYKLLATIADNSTTTYADNIADGALGATAPTDTSAGALAAQDTDTQLQNASVRGALTAVTIANNQITLQFFFSDAALANGTYSEFGSFVDGSGSVNTGQLFNRAVFGTLYTKATGEDTTVEVVLTITAI